VVTVGMFDEKVHVEVLRHGQGADNSTESVGFVEEFMRSEEISRGDGPNS